MPTTTTHKKTLPIAIAPVFINTLAAIASNAGEPLGRDVARAIRIDVGDDVVALLYQAGLMARKDEMIVVVVARLQP